MPCNDNVLDDDQDWSDYDSGPFCPHWNSPGECDEVCTKCGHGCNDHYGDLGCQIEGCDCEELELEEDD